MRGLEIWFHDLIAWDESQLQTHTHLQTNGGLFLENSVVSYGWLAADESTRRRDNRSYSAGGFMSVSLSTKGNTSHYVQDSNAALMVAQDRYKNVDNSNFVDETTSFEMGNEYLKKRKEKVKLSGGASAFNTSKHLWAGAVSAMVSRF